MLHTTLNVLLKQYVGNKEFYGELPKLSDKIRQRRLKVVGHCSISQRKPVSKTYFTGLHPKHTRRKPGRPALNYSDILKQDTGMESTVFRTATKDRKILRAMKVRGHHLT